MSIWDSISLLALSIESTHQNLPYMLRRYSIWEVVLYRSLPPVFLLFPLSHLIYFDAWRVFCMEVRWCHSNFLWAPFNFMTMIYSSLFQLDLFEKEIFRNITQVFFLPARWQVPKWQKNIIMTSGVVCSLVLLEKNLQNHGHIFYVYAYIWTFIFDDSFSNIVKKKKSFLTTYS